MRKSPSKRGKTFPKLPQVCLKYGQQGELDLFEPRLLLIQLGWNIDNYPAKLKFQAADSSVQFSIDLNDKEEIGYSQKSTQQLSFHDIFLDFTEYDLVRWLDRQIEHDDITQERILSFLQRVIQNLLVEPNVDLAVLLQNKFPLARAIKV